MKKIKKITATFISMILALVSKVYAVDNLHSQSSIQPAYGINMPTYSSKSNIELIIALILEILKVVAIPLIIIIGLIVYLKKGKNKVLRELAVVFIILTILCIIGYYSVVIYIDSL